MRKIELRANAKINLALSVTGKRSDGYHEIDTVMQSIDLCDWISIAKSDTLCVKCPGVSQRDNLATRAAELFFQHTGIKQSAFIEIEKHIPVSAGLGGGSSDAASVLMGLNRLYHADIPQEQLAEMAVALGADVPFFLKGGTLRAKGIGEQLTGVRNKVSWYYLLYTDGEKLSTKEMYQRLDHTSYPKPDMDLVVKALQEGDSETFFAVTDNSFSALWEKTETEAMLLKAGAGRVLLSGSGPTRFAVFSDEPAAHSAGILLKNIGLRSFLSRPVEEDRAHSQIVI